MDTIEGRYAVQTADHVTQEPVVQSTVRAH